MKFALPILAADGREFADARALDALLSGETSGHYLLGNHRKWHGGIHISDASAPWCRDKHPVRAMADGKVVAFRMLDHYLSSEFQGEALRYSNCFCLIEHHYCETNPETQAKNEFTFYSLYMHLKPWQPEQDGERLVLKKRWNVRNSVPHHQPDAEQQKADAKLPATPLPAGTELEPVAQCEPVWGTVAGKDYRFIKVSIPSALSPEVQTAGAQAGVLLTQGSQVWIAEDDTALERIKPSQPLWLFDEIDAELTCDLEGHADPQFNGPTGKLLAGGYNTSLPSGTQVQYDAHRLEFHWLDGKARKMARCHYRTPAQGSQPERTGVAWVCVEESNIRIRHQRPTHLNQLYVLPSPVAISAGETVGFLGLMENPASSLGGKQGKYQVHLELFTQDPRLDGVLANQANTAGGTRYARVPAGLTLYQKRDNQWVATTAQSQAALLTAPRVEQSGDKCWLCVKEGTYVAKEQAEMLSQHDWLKLGFKKVDGSGSDGYLDPQQAPAFFEELVHCLDTNQDGHLSSEEITAALCHIEPILHSPQSRTRLQKLIVRHPSEWYDKSAGASHQWLDKLKAQVAKPEFDQLVAHEKQRIDQLEWMQSATSLKLSRDIWHFWPLGMAELARTHQAGVTPEQLKLIFPQASDEDIQAVVTELDGKLEAYKLDTPFRLRHFFSQIRGEVGPTMKGRTESFQFSPSALLSFSDYYKAHPAEAEEDGCVKDPRTNRITRRANEQAIGRKHYSRLNGNRSDHPDDGLNLRGRGLIQITGYEKYYGLFSDYNNYWTDTPPDFVNQPEKVNEMPYAIRSAVWFWLYRTVYRFDLGNGASDVIGVTKRVNGRDMGLTERQEAYELCTQVFK